VPVGSEALEPLVAIESVSAPLSARALRVSPVTTAPPLAPVARLTLAQPAALVAIATIKSRVRMR
jgi:hypothetical protein